MPAIKEARATMASLQGKMTSKNRELFLEAQAVIKQQREKLANIGLGSRGLDDLWYVNWNRPDRDKVGDRRSIIDVYELEQ